MVTKGTPVPTTQTVSLISLLELEYRYRLPYRYQGITTKKKYMNQPLATCYFATFVIVCKYTKALVAPCQAAKEGLTCLVVMNSMPYWVVKMDCRRYSHDERGWREPHPEALRGRRVLLLRIRKIYQI